MTNGHMRVGIATDHGGFELKEELAPRLRAAGYEVVDFGAAAHDPDDDYPDFVIPLAEAVANGRVERGVAICGSGVGASVCANKIPGIRAALIPDHFSARQGVEDDHVNVICLGGRTMDPKAQIVGEFVKSIRVPGYYPPLPELRQQLRTMVTLMDEPAPGLARIEDVQIPGPAGPIPARAMREASNPRRKLPSWHLPSTSHSPPRRGRAAAPFGTPVARAGNRWGLR